MKKVLVSLFTLYVSVPVLLFLFPWILGHAIFAHLFRAPFLVDLSRPQDLLNHTQNFYLDTDEGISVGVWHTLPSSQWEAAREKSSSSPEWYQEALGDGNPVIIYLHGNAGTRAANHRVELVKILSATGYHVFSLDYRGFGDSSGDPSEAGMTSDALYLYHWVKQRSRGSLVCFWGQSLGTGVATNAAVRLQEQGSTVDAVILQAPYTRIGEIVAMHTLSKLYIFLPGFKSLLGTIMERIDVEFANDKNLKTLTSPLLILHAKDDNVVPYYMGQELYEISVETHRKKNKEVHVEMVSYSEDLGYSHRDIYLDPDLANVVKKFLQNLRR